LGGPSSTHSCGAQPGPCRMRRSCWRRGRDSADRVATGRARPSRRSAPPRHHCEGQARNPRTSSSFHSSDFGVLCAQERHKALVHRQGAGEAKLPVAVASHRRSEHRAVPGSHRWTPFAAWFLTGTAAGPFAPAQQPSTLRQLWASPRPTSPRRPCTGACPRVPGKYRVTRDGRPDAGRTRRPKRSRSRSRGRS
jgi:hypothetical protein